MKVKGEVPPGRVKSQSTEHGREKSLATEQRLEPAGDDFDPEYSPRSFYQYLMESNTPPPGIGAGNAD